MKGYIDGQAIDYSRGQIRGSDGVDGRVAHWGGRPVV
jgi:hypothetical protein